MTENETGSQATFKFSRRVAQCTGLLHHVRGVPDEVQIRTTDAAGSYFDQNLAGTGFRSRNFFDSQLVVLEDDRTHGYSPITINLEESRPNASQ